MLLWTMLVILTAGTWLHADTGRSAISVAELGHRAPASALRQYRESSKALAGGDLFRAIRGLEQGLQQDPDNIGGHNDLGILYLEAKQPEQALKEFRRMLEIEPRSPAGHRNLSYAMLALKRFEDAEAAARRSLQLDRASALGHMLLGFSLIGQWKHTSEALTCLHRAAQEFSEALLAVADLLIRLGRPDEARREIERYIASGTTEQKDLAEGLLRMLTFE